MATLSAGQSSPGLHTGVWQGDDPLVLGRLRGAIAIRLLLATVEPIETRMGVDGGGYQWMN